MLLVEKFSVFRFFDQKLETIEATEGEHEPNAFQFYPDHMLAIKPTSIPTLAKCGYIWTDKWSCPHKTFI